jgi:hypothetical protein
MGARPAIDKEDVPPQSVSPCTTEAQRGCTAADEHYNPTAPLVPLLTLALLARAFVGRVFGYWITPTRQRRAVTVWSVMLALVALVALEITKSCTRTC